MNKKDHRDDIEGILLFLYENELKQLSGEVTTLIRFLLSKGLLKEFENTSGRKYYQLSNSFRFISKNIK